MTNRTPSEPTGGDGLMLVIAAAVVVVVIGEAAFVAFPSVWLLPLVILGALVVTAGVIFALLRTIDGDTPVPTPKPRPRTVPEPETTANPIHARPLIGH